MGVLTPDMKRVVSEQRLGFVATVCSDGTPNLSPKGTTEVWDDDHLFFADLRSPQTIRNIRLNPAMEVNVVDQVVRKGYRFKGNATVHTEGEIFERGLLLLQANREIQPDRVRAIVLMNVTKAEPLISPAYDWGRTENEVRDEWERYWDALRLPKPSRAN